MVFEVLFVVVFQVRLGQILNRDANGMAISCCTAFEPWADDGSVVLVHALTCQRCLTPPLYFVGHFWPHTLNTPSHITVMAPWQDKDEWKLRRLLMFVMPPILLGNILDIYYQLK
jgi:hypothetical protein